MTLFLGIVAQIVEGAASNSFCFVLRKAYSMAEKTPDKICHYNKFDKSVECFTNVFVSTTLVLKAMRIKVISAKIVTLNDLPCKAWSSTREYISFILSVWDLNDKLWKKDIQFTNKDTWVHGLTRIQKWEPFKTNIYRSGKSKI